MVPYTKRWVNVDPASNSNFPAGNYKFVFHIRNRMYALIIKRRRKGLNAPIT